MSYDPQDVVDDIVGKLGRYRDRDDIIKSLCERYGFTWEKSVEQVRRVEQTHGHLIAAKKNRIVIFLGIAFIIVGAMLLLVTIYMSLDGWIVIIAGIPYLGNLLAIGTGVGLLTGGILGIVKREQS